MLILTYNLGYYASPKDIRERVVDIITSVIDTIDAYSDHNIKIVAYQECHRTVYEYITKTMKNECFSSGSGISFVDSECGELIFVKGAKVLDKTYTKFSIGKGGISTVRIEDILFSTCCIDYEYIHIRNIQHKELTKVLTDGGMCHIFAGSTGPIECNNTVFSICSYDVWEMYGGERYTIDYMENSLVQYNERSRLDKILYTDPLLKFSLIEFVNKLSLSDHFGIMCTCIKEHNSV